MHDAWPDNRVDDEGFYTCLAKVVASVVSNRDSWPFREPVDPRAVPMYHQVIEEPIDLSIIKLKVEEKSYKSIREVEMDFKLMVNNCETFNGPKNGYTAMVYAVWRAFRRAVIRYFDKDLEEDEQTVFLYPPKPKEQAPTAAIEARRKKCAAKHRKRMKALEVLQRAAEIAVRDAQAGRSALTATLPSPRKDPDFIIFDELSKNKVSKVSGPLTGEALMKYLYNASNDSSLTAFYVDAQDNLTFKSLTEWSDSIKNAGNQIVLPQDAVLISSSASINDLTPDLSASEQEMDEGTKFRTLQVFHVSDSPSSFLDNASASASPSSTTSQDDNALPTSNNNSNSRTLVIKLSRCSESGKMWRPVRFVADQNHNDPDS